MGNGIDKEAPIGYKVFKNATEFTLVEANSAWEAIEKSDIKNPYKVISAIQLNEFLDSDSKLQTKGFEIMGAENIDDILAPQEPEEPTSEFTDLGPPKPSES